jgi:hypothetical protein
VAGAAAYVVLFEVPGGGDEAGNPYISLTGVRVPVGFLAFFFFFCFYTFLLSFFRVLWFLG